MRPEGLHVARVDEIIAVPTRRAQVLFSMLGNSTTRITISCLFVMSTVEEIPDAILDCPILTV